MKRKALGFQEYFDVSQKPQINFDSAITAMCAQIFWINGKL